MIRVLKWENHQHYKKPKPVWIKVYRDLLNNYEFCKLDPQQKWTLVGLWLLAAETGNAIPDDVVWIQHRLQLTHKPDLETLQTLGFISLGTPSIQPLEQVYTQTEKRRDREETDTVAKATERSLDVEHWEWGDFAGWMRREGCQKVWGGPEPPDWAHDDLPWTLERELSVWRALHKKGETLEALHGVISRNKEPTCGKHFYELGRWDRYYLAKAEWQKAEAMKGNQLSAILGDMAKKAS